MANQAKYLFRLPEIGTFFQVQPKLSNPFLGDGFLQRTLNRLLPAQINKVVSRDLTRFGDRVVSELEPLATECESNPPHLEQFDAWGTRVDKIITCNAWKTLKTITAEEGLIAIGYEKQYGEYSRLYQFAKTYLFAPSSAFFHCPLAATDGAAKTLKVWNSALLDPAFKHATSRDPSQFWTSGQWMTERKGGSDVGSGTETIAIPREDGKYNLHGYKWFTSVMDADMSITLARVVDKDGNVTPGSTGLSMFCVQTRSNGVKAMRLKNKLGTKALPTGELLLDGTEADLISVVGRGIPSIGPMLTITRLHNALASVSLMRRIQSLARDYSKRRVCFGLPIAKYPLHVNTMASLELQIRGGTSLLFECVRLLGLVESGLATEDEEHCLRLLTPVVKLYTAKKGMGVMSEGLELFGGQGYIEDTGTPKYFRDAQLLPIWEGTTNILSLDVLRAVGKSKGQVLQALQRRVKKSLQESTTLHPELSSVCNIINTQLDQLVRSFKEQMVQEAIARLYAFTIAEIAIGTLLIEHASSREANASDITTAVRWARSLQNFDEELDKMKLENDQDSNDLIFDSFDAS